MVSKILKNNDSSTDSEPSDGEVRDTLTAVVSSEAFSTSPRLQEFLRYVVEETLSGRGGRIKSKTVAVDVYHRQLGAGGDAQNLVRVEARRLRRLLSDYYETQGNSDPLQIKIPTGGYTPSFIKKRPTTTDMGQVAEQPTGGQKRISLKLFIFGAGVALISIGALVLKQSEEPSITTSQSAAILDSLRVKSVPALQANNVAQQARGMLFPLFDAKRQQLALEMFQYAIELEPKISHGYSGAAQVLATLSFISPNEELANKLLNDARDMTDKALDLDPSDAWAHGALGWTLAVSNAFDEALKHAQLAFELAPEDGHVLDLVGIIAILIQEPELAADVSNPDRPKWSVGRLGTRNIWGVSQYMLGNYSATIEAFSGAPANGAPVSPPSLIFLAVAYDHQGNTAQARSLVEELSTTWPEFPTAFLVRRIFQDGTVFERDILQRLNKYGYNSRVE
jgi:tetratricopeptide (TPR) repeat protein